MKTKQHTPKQLKEKIKQKQKNLETNVKIKTQYTEIYGMLQKHF